MKNIEKIKEQVKDIQNLFLKKIILELLKKLKKQLTIILIFLFFTIC